MRKVILKVKNLTKKFEDKTILDNVSFEVREGEQVAIIGASGGGKTTLLRCLNLLEQPTGGEILLDGSDITRIKDLNSVRQKIGMVFQDFNLFPNMTVLKNATLAAYVHGKARLKRARKNGESNAPLSDSLKKLKTELDKRAMNLLKQFGIEDKAKAYPQSLSGGQKQRAAIIRALMDGPQIMLFDEPTASLGPASKKSVSGEIRQLAAKGLTNIIVSHDMAFVRYAADRCLFIAEGRVIEDGATEQIFDAPKTPLLKAFMDDMSL